jgi:hypothetical protein
MAKAGDCRRKSPGGPLRADPLAPFLFACIKEQNPRSDRFHFSQPTPHLLAKTGANQGSESQFPRLISKQERKKIIIRSGRWKRPAEFLEVAPRDELKEFTSLTCRTPAA